MSPYPPERVLAGVITLLITLCHVTGQEARAQAGSERGARARAATRPPRPRPKEENEKARSLLEEGLRRADQKDWVAALRAFEQALAVSPRYAQAYIATGDTYMDMGKYEEGFEAYRQAIRAAPSNPDAHYSLGAAYNDMAQYGDAFKHFVQAIRLSPDFAEAHYGIGYAYLRLDNFKDALVYLRRAAQLQPDYWEAHLALGQTYLGLRDMKAANKELQILARLDASAAANLEKEIVREQRVGQLPDRTVGDGRAEGAPPAGDRSVTKNAAQEQAAGISARPAAKKQEDFPAHLPSPMSRPTMPGGDAALVVELSFWDSIKNSRNPEEFAAYLNKYPEGQFAELAKIRMHTLAGQKGGASGVNSGPTPATPTVNATTPDHSMKPVPPTTAANGSTQRPKEKPAEAQPDNDQPSKEEPKGTPPAGRPKSGTAGGTGEAAAVKVALDSLRASLPSKFTYRVRPADEPSATGTATAEVEINYEPLKFDGCTIEWRDQQDVLRVSLSELDPDAVRVGPRSRPGAAFSTEIWDVSILVAGGKAAISESKVNGGGTVNRFSALDLQYENKEKAERLARDLRKTIKLCGGKP